jgi:hypothetical protein
MQLKELLDLGLIHPSVSPLNEIRMDCGDFALTTVNCVRKTGPWSNKIKQMRKQNKEDTQYNRDRDLCGSPSVGYVH